MNEPKINLKALRKAKGWTQTETATRLGFCRTYVTDVENERQGISKTMMRAIIKVFNVTYEKFYQDKQDSS